MDDKYNFQLLLRNFSTYYLGYFVLGFFCLVKHFAAQQINWTEHTNCPNLDMNVYHKIPKKVLNGNMIHRNTAYDLSQCTELCCNMTDCTAAVFMDDGCYAVTCGEPIECELVIPYEASVILVRPFLSNFSDTSDKRINCEVGMRQCPPGADCQPLNSRRRNGICVCKNGLTQTDQGTCIQNLDSDSTVKPLAHVFSNVDSGKNSSGTKKFTYPTTIHNNEMTNATPIKEQVLLVSVNNKTVYIPEGHSVYEEGVTLSAYVIGAPTNCKYEWSLVAQPESSTSGSVTDYNSQTIKLSNLVPGVYIFKIQVEAQGAVGEAVANVTVLFPRHKNQPPRAVIIPANQTIKLPKSTVILDGSNSTDDAGIESYGWVLTSGPIGYHLIEQTGESLQLTDLIPGNYTIVLTVKNLDGLEGNTTAFVEVIRQTDYPPTANAGGDQIIYLPQTETVLNGNGSTDDHGIVEWEWTKGPEDSGKAVDMQNTRTSYLKLSNLEEGIYHFVLRVTDGSGQSATSSAHVYVHQPNLNPPKANAGEDMTLFLPNTTALLDASKTSEITPQTHFLWKLKSGVTSVVFSSFNEMKTNISGLTKGTYIVTLTVWNGDDSSYNSTDTVTITVIQDKNQPPVASGGGDFSVRLPVTLVSVDGSGSTDDVGIVKWLWQRVSGSLAAGTILNRSDTSPVLILGDVVAGQYIWQLTVWDDQGASDSDTVSIIVKEAEHQNDQLEVVIGVDIGSLSHAQMSSLLHKLELLLQTQSQQPVIKVLSLTGKMHSGQVTITLLGIDGNRIISGKEMAYTLWDQVISQQSLPLGLPVISIDTVVCQNNCSGHGECIQATRECRCHSWWMESFIKRHLGDGRANCNWSLIYVFVTVVVLAGAAGLLGWGLMQLVSHQVQARRAKHCRSKLQSYSLLESFEDGEDSSVHFTAGSKSPRVPASLLESDSDSETQILFDTKSNVRHLQKNGFIKT